MPDNDYKWPDSLANIQIRGDVSHKGHSGGKVLIIGGGGPYAGLSAQRHQDIGRPGRKRPVDVISDLL